MFLVYYISVSWLGAIGTDWANDGISGDGFLYTGGAAYEEAVGEWEGEQANIEAYLAAAEEDGIDVEGATAALEAEEPTAADESALAAFQEDAEKAGVVGIVEDEETGEPVDVDADDEEYGLVIMKVVEENGEELLSTLDSDEEIEEIYNLFMERFFQEEDQ